MNNLQQIEQTLTSMEVAEMVEKPHNDLLKDIRRYIKQLGEGKISQSEFFTESNYQNSQNKVQPCYKVTKKGCEFIAHKLTGTKGTIFTARYINRFHEMQELITERKNQLWYIRNFNGKQIVLFRDFEALTGIKPDPYVWYKRPKCSRLIGGLDWNMYTWNKSKEDFKEKYGFEYGEKKCLEYLYLRGFIKVLKIIMSESEQYTQKEKVKQILAEVSKKSIQNQEYKALADKNTTPVQINITFNVDKTGTC